MHNASLHAVHNADPAFIIALLWYFLFLFAFVLFLYYISIWQYLNNTSYVNTIHTECFYTFLRFYVILSFRSLSLFILFNFSLFHS